MKKTIKGFIFGVLFTVLCYSIVGVMSRIATLEYHVDAIGNFLAQAAR